MFLSIIIIGNIVGNILLEKHLKSADINFLTKIVGILFESQPYSTFLTNLLWDQLVDDMTGNYHT